MWVPGHEGHVGNEKADLLAKKGACSPCSSPEPFCGVNNGFHYDEIRSWSKNSLLEWWSAQSGMRQSKRLIAPERINSEKILNLSRKDIKLYTELMIGHCRLNYHLHKLGLVDNDYCRFCNESQETSEHILCSCPAVARSRLLYLGAVIFRPVHLSNSNPSVILRFVNSLGLH